MKRSLLLLLALVLLLPAIGHGQTTNSRTFSGSGTSITATGSSLNTNVTNTVAISGTVSISGSVAATQSGVWTVQPGNTANTTAWKVDGSAVTQPISGTVTATQGGAPWAENVTQFGGTNLSTGTGTGGAGIPRVTVSSDSSMSITGTVTVSGTVAATQSGVWTVQPGNTANTTAWKVDGSAVTQPVSGTFFQTYQPVQIRNAAGDALGTKANPFIVASATQQSVNSGFVDQYTQRVELPFNGQGQVRLAAGSQTVGAVLGTQADNAGNVSTKLPVLNARANTLSPTWTEGNLAPQSVDLFGSLRIREMDQFGQAWGTQNNPITVTIQSAALLTNPNPLTLAGGTTFGGNKTTVAVLANQGALRGGAGAVPGDYGLVVHPSVAPAMQCPFVKSISITASTQLVTNLGGQWLHVCTFSVILAGAESLSLVEGTGSTCGTGTTGLYGGTSASAAFLANGGVNISSDRIQVPMQVRGDNLCLLKSAANNVSGTLTYGIY